MSRTKFKIGDVVEYTAKNNDDPMSFYRSLRGCIGVVRGYSEEHNEWKVQWIRFLSPQKHHEADGSLAYFYKSGDLKLLCHAEDWQGVPDGEG